MGGILQASAKIFRLNSRERMPSLGAPPRQHFAAILRLHSRAEPVLLMAPPDMRLKRALRQRVSSLSSVFANSRKSSAHASKACILPAWAARQVEALRMNLLKCMRPSQT